MFTETAMFTLDMNMRSVLNIRHPVAYSQRLFFHGQCVPWYALTTRETVCFGQNRPIVLDYQKMGGLSVDLSEFRSFMRPSGRAIQRFSLTISAIAMPSSTIVGASSARISPIADKI